MAGNRWWTTSDNDYLLRNWRSMSDEEIAEHLGRTTQSVQQRRFYLGLNRRHVCGAYGQVRKTCAWTSKNRGVYATQCGEEFDWGRFSDFAMPNFCPTCGGKVTEEWK